MQIKTVKVLLVEDNEDDVLLAQESFADAKTVEIIYVVSNGEELLAYLRKQGDYKTAIVPDVVLMDINMPRMNGLEALQAVKQDPELRYIPVIMLTTSNRSEDVNSAFNFGASSYIPKPNGFKEFQRVAQNFAEYWVHTSLVPSEIGRYRFH